jgi:hypothetical protein
MPESSLSCETFEETVLLLDWYSRIPEAARSYSLALNEMLLPVTVVLVVPLR